MLSTLDDLLYNTKLRWNKLHKFKSKIQFSIESGSFVIKTIDSCDELIESLRLRHRVFNNEFRGIKGSGLDLDRYDYFFDHLVIIHKDTKNIVGTYRLQCVSSNKNSYTAQEFHLEALNLNRQYLELGRACIQKEFRKGIIMALLWRGIAEYMNLSGADKLFGCSSIKVDDARQAALIYKFLFDTGNVQPIPYTRPTKKFTMKHFSTWMNIFEYGLSEEQIEETEKLVPTLVKSYLKIGAKVVCEPAYDKDYKCIDLLTILKKEDLSETMRGKFQVSV